MNITDPDPPDSGPRGFMQGYNAQAVAPERPDHHRRGTLDGLPTEGMLEPMIIAARDELAATGIDGRPTSC